MDKLSPFFFFLAENHKNVTVGLQSAVAGWVNHQMRRLRKRKTKRGEKKRGIGERERRRGYTLKILL